MRLQRTQAQRASRLRYLVANALMVRVHANLHGTFPTARHEMTGGGYSRVSCDANSWTVTSPADTTKRTELLPISTGAFGKPQSIVVGVVSDAHGESGK